LKIAFSSRYLCHFGSIDFELMPSEPDSRDSAGKATVRGRLNLGPGGRD
jgi:hypothetical protein